MWDSVYSSAIVTYCSFYVLKMTLRGEEKRGGRTRNAFINGLLAKPEQDGK